MRARIRVTNRCMHASSQRGACPRADHLNSGEPGFPLSAGFSITTVHPAKNAASASSAVNSANALCSST